MVAHQHVGVQGAAIAKQRFSQALQVTLPVLIIEEARQAIVAALDHVLWHTGDVETRESGHAGISRKIGHRDYRRLSEPTVRELRMPSSESVSDTVFAAGLFVGGGEVALLSQASKAPRAYRLSDTIGDWGDLGVSLRSREVANSAEDTAKVFRVEGNGNQRLLIDEAGNVEIPEIFTNKGRGPERNLYLNFGDEARAQQFLEQRLEQFPDSTIKSFEVPRSFLDELRATAVPEIDRSLYPNRPVIADPRRHLISLV